VIPAPNADSIYEVPLIYHREGLDTEVLRSFAIENAKAPDLSIWEEIAERVRAPEGAVNIAIIGKYTGLQDAYKSLSEALTHGGIAHNVRVNMRWIEAEVFEAEGSIHQLEDVNGILVPGGFGGRGAEGKITAVTFARERRVPYFGICFGMQLAVVEIARNLAGLAGASSTEFGPCADPVVGLLSEWVREGQVETRSKDSDLGGTMRLGAYPARLRQGSRIAEIYGRDEISERHRHRYEVNINYRAQLEEAGLKFAAMSPDGTLPEAVELAEHPWFVGVQFHPELKSKPFDPHPLFASFIGAAISQSRLV
jgi:CTP synthase